MRKVLTIEEALISIADTQKLMLERIAPSRRGGVQFKFDPQHHLPRVKIDPIIVPDGTNYMWVSMLKGTVAGFWHDQGMVLDESRSADFYLGPTPTPSPIPIMTREENRIYMYVLSLSADPAVGSIYFNKW